MCSEWEEKFLLWMNTSSLSTLLLFICLNNVPTANFIPTTVLNLTSQESDSNNCNDLYQRVFRKPKLILTPASLLNGWHNFIQYVLRVPWWRTETTNYQTGRHSLWIFAFTSGRCSFNQQIATFHQNAPKALKTLLLSFIMTSFWQKIGTNPIWETDPLWLAVE